MMGGTWAKWQSFSQSAVRVDGEKCLWFSPS